MLKYDKKYVYESENKKECRNRIKRRGIKIEWEEMCNCVKRSLRKSILRRIVERRTTGI